MTNTGTNAVYLDETNAIAALDGIIKDVNTTDLGNGVTYYTYFDLMADAFCNFSLQYKITDTTITVEATNDLPSVVDGSAEWFDCSTDILGAANKTATGAVHCANKYWSRMRVKALTTNATNALELRLTRGR